MNREHIPIVVTTMVLLSVRDALGTFGSDDWTARVLDGFRGMNGDLIQDTVKQLNEQIRESVQSQLTQVHRLQKNIIKNIENINTDGASVYGKWPSIVVHDTGATSRSVYYGHTYSGQPYYRDSEDRIMGNVLYHTDRIYDPSGRTTLKEYRYTLDLKDPMAKAVPLHK